MKMLPITLLALLGASLFGSATYTQGFDSPSAKDPGEDMAKIFGKDLAFTATALTTMKDRSSHEVHSMQIAYAVRDGNVRTETDMTKIKSPDMPAEALAHMRQMGMDRTIHIYRSDTHVAYLIYPGLKAYCQLPTSTKTDDAKPPRIQRTELGKDTIDGHPCTKIKMTVTPENGKTFEAIVWEAHDLKNFPIQTEFGSDGVTVTTLFKNINLTPPAASLFEPPAQFKRYPNMQELMMSGMQRMMQNMGGTGD